MEHVEQYPVVLRCEGLRARPVRVQVTPSGAWRVDWIGGLVTLYRRDPRGHLERGYEPKHLRWWQPPPEYGEKSASGPMVGVGHRRP